MGGSGGPGWQPKKKTKPYPTFLILGLGFFWFFWVTLREKSGIILMSPGFYFCNLIAVTLS